MLFEPGQDEAALIEEGRLLFAKECDFTAGADQVSRLPDPILPEVAFAGRSNVGKSSLINALTGRNGLARTSNTPGRTQQLNFFDLGHRLMLVDLPGYGYAEASKEKIGAWTGLIKQYLRGRVLLRRACVLVDARHGLKDSDHDVMKLLDQSAVPYLVVMTKADKVKPTELPGVVSLTQIALKKHGAAFPFVHVTSSETGLGIAELRGSLAMLAEKAVG